MREQISPMSTDPVLSSEYMSASCASSMRSGARASDPCTRLTRMSPFPTNLPEASWISIGARDVLVTVVRAALTHSPSLFAASPINPCSLTKASYFLL